MDNRNRLFRGQLSYRQFRFVFARLLPAICEKCRTHLIKALQNERCHMNFIRRTYIAAYRYFGRRQKIVSLLTAYKKPLIIWLRDRVSGTQLLAYVHVQ